jgi:hypothetical protein
VHRRRRGEEGRAGVPHAGGHEGRKEEVAAGSVIDVLDDRPVEARLDVGADDGEKDADAEELLPLKFASGQDCVSSASSARARLLRAAPERGEARGKQRSSAGRQR